MDILSHFDRHDLEKLILYKINEEEIDDFINKLTDGFRDCYIIDSDLKKYARELKISQSEFIRDYILPDIGNVKSGDFGEMLSYHVLIDNYGGKRILLSGPKKWRWKGRNKSSPGNDVILFHISNPNTPSSDDMVITAESKMKATRSNSHRIQDAIEGAVIDKLSRTAKTLIWLDEKYARSGDLKRKENLARFLDPSKYGTYQKVHKAIAIIDSEFEKEELEKEIINEEEIVVIVLSINQLLDGYEKTFDNIINST